MKYRYIPFLISTFLCISLFAQTPLVARNWQKKVANNFEEVDNGTFLDFDYSEVFSNHLRFDGDIWSSYVGVFGAKDTRIEFNLIVTKSTNEIYEVIGKSKLGTNIRDLKGTFTVQNFLTDNRNAYVMLFEYKLKEPGDRNGDGFFTGIGVITFKMQKDKVDIYWGASGEYREYNNVFVGTWNKYNSSAIRECIFSFSPTGFAKLPYRNYLYKEFENDDECECYFEIKESYDEYGWKNYDGGFKDVWWRNN